MFFFALLFVRVFFGGAGRKRWFLFMFLFGWFCLGDHSFGALEGPVPREEKEGEHRALTRFREEAEEEREDL